MKLRQFISILAVVALAAVIYSPSTIGFSASPGGDGGTAPTDVSGSGTSMFISYLHQSGYQIILANDTAQVMATLVEHQKFVYLLVGPDLAMASIEVKEVASGYESGRISTLIAEGNVTNSGMLGALGVDVTGTPIVDPTSSFQDKRVFNVDLGLGSTNTTGVIDIASPLLLNRTSTLHAVAVTSPSSTDVRNATKGPRTVVAAGSSASGARAIVLTDSAPFTNFLFNYTQQGGVDEKSFVAAMLSWVDPGKNTTILFDNSQYLGAKLPKYEVGLPIGPLVTYGIEQSISSLNGYYISFPSQVSGFLGGLGIHVSDGVASALVALLLLFSIYGAVTRWFAPETKGRDDQPVLSVEKTIVAQSKERTVFLKASRSKGGYLATLVQLHDMLDSVVVSEFASGVSAVEESELAARIGVDDARRTKKLFLSLSKLSDYASGDKRFLFPPVLRWRALTARTIKDAEGFLNRLGISVAEEEGEARQSEQMKYLMKEKVGA